MVDSIYEVYSLGNGHPLLEKDLAAFEDAKARGEEELAKQILLDAAGLARQIRTGQLEPQAVPGEPGK